MTACTCPVCQGRGLVPNGFYRAVGVDSWTTNSLEPEQCRSCDGKGYVVVGLEPVFQQPVTLQWPPMVYESYTTITVEPDPNLSVWQAPALWPLHWRWGGGRYQ